MRFMLIVRSVPDFEAELRPDPDPEVMAEMAAFHDELARAGVLLDGSGLRPSRDGWRVVHGEGSAAPRVVDGPFAEVKELIAGYTLIQVRSREEALEWSRRYPNPVGRGRAAVVEVRQLYELDDFTPGESLDRFKDIEQRQAAKGSRP